MRDWRAPQRRHRARERRADRLHRRRRAADAELRRRASALARRAAASDRARRGDQHRELRRSAGAGVDARNYSGNYFWTTNVSCAAGRRSRGRRLRRIVHRVRLGRHRARHALARARRAGGVQSASRSPFTTSRAPRSGNVEKMMRQARAQARTAVQLRAKHPHWRVDLRDRDNPLQRALPRGSARALRPAAALRAPSARSRRRRALYDGRAARRARAGQRSVLRRTRTARCSAVRIVLSRTDRVGDLILSTPAIATVRASFPEAHITIVCSEYNAVVVERNADVDELSVLPRGSKPARVRRALSRRRSGDRARAARAPTCGWSARRARRCASATRTSGAGSRA